MRFAVRAYKVDLRSDTPQNYHKAVSSSEKIQWIEAMQEEIDSHQIIKTRELTELLKSQKVFPSRWVYTKKYCLTGVFEKYKAH